MKLPGEAGGNWSERQTKARTYGHGLQLHSAAVGRRLGHLLPTLFSWRISDPFAIVNPGHSFSSARAELFHSSCQLRELEANVEPVKLRGSSAAQGEGCTRERVLVCRLRDCDATPRTHSQSHSLVLVPVPVPVLVPIPVPIPVPDHISPRREGLNSLPELLPFLLHNARSTRDMPVCVQPAFSTAFWLLTRDSLIKLVVDARNRTTLNRNGNLRPNFIREKHTNSRSYAYR